MSFTLPPSLTTSYPPSQRVVRRAFMINLCLTTSLPGESTMSAPTRFERQMGERDIGEKDVFVGIAGLKSLDMLSLIGCDKMKRYKRAVLVDINEHQISAMKETLELIRKNETSEGFVRDFTKMYPSYLRPPAPGEPDYHSYVALSDSEKYQFYNAFGSSYQPHNEEQIKRYLSRFQGGRECNWLTPSNYQFIRQMALNDDIAVATMDLRDRERVGILKKTLELDGLHPRDIYISSAMDFANPSLMTDYYSKGSTIEQAQAFFDNLLTLADDKTGYITSSTSGSMPILQSYHLGHIDKAAVQKKRDELPSEVPPYNEQDYSMLINAGGMVWRLHSFLPTPGDATHPPTERYFRIFSEVPSPNRGELEEQVAIINKTLTGQKGLTVPHVLPYETTDVSYFAYEAADKESPYTQLSSQPFQLSKEASAATIGELVQALKTDLNRGLRGVA